MAQTVILKTEGYGTIEADLKTLHIELEEQMRQNIEAIRAILGKNADFYAETVTPKVESLLTVIEQDILNGIPSLFTETEKGIASFVQSIIETDVY